MRIVGGELGGIVLRPPKGLPVRPTTERAKESLFNILSNQFDLEEVTALDLFSGTGNITVELLSRGYCMLFRWSNISGPINSLQKR